MSTITMSLKVPWLRSETLQRLWKTNRLLTLLGFASLGLLAVAALMALLDPRLITGAPAWAKPAKFAISSAFYTLTLVWMLSYIHGQRRLVRLVGNVTALALAVELFLIVFQVLRGVRSHFNFSTPLDGAIYSTMAVFIMITWVMGLLAALLLIRQPLTDRPWGLSLRLGLLIALYGAGVGSLMTRPTPGQMAEMQTGKMASTIGAHSVGVEDSGPGLPFLGWSTEDGDMRVPHFFGLHALQAIPLAGFAINRYFQKRLSEGRRVALVWTMGLGYLGGAVLLTWQALRGQSIVAPDRLMLVAFSAWTVLVASTFGLIAAVRNKA